MIVAAGGKGDTRHGGVAESMQGLTQAGELSEGPRGEAASYGCTRAALESCDGEGAEDQSTFDTEEGIITM